MYKRQTPRTINLKKLIVNYTTPSEKLIFLEELYKHKHCKRSISVEDLAYIFDCQSKDIINALIHLKLYNTKLCKTCESWLPYSEFYYTDASETRIWDAHCIKCKNKINTTWHDNNKEYHNEHNALNNRTLYKDKINNTHILRKKSDIAYALKKMYGSAIWQYLKRSSNSSILINLPFNINDLKPHLESQFDANMGWSNYGTYWSIDHIKPISKFNITDVACVDFKLCWSLDNLRPLENSENFKKYNKYVAGT